MDTEHDLKSLDELKKTRVTLLTKEVAALLGVSQRTLVRWRQAGEGPPYISLGAYSTALYPIDKFEAWLQNEAI